MIHDNKIEENSVISLQVSPDEAAQRIDKFVATKLTSYSRSFLQKLFKNKQVTINDKIAKPSQTIHAHDIIVITFPPAPVSRSEQEYPEDIGVKIIAQEEDFLIICKPAGLIVHPPDNTCKDVTLSDWIAQQYKEIARVGIIDRPGIVHRLDRDTSGIMIIPRTNQAHATFSQMFKDRKIKKSYLALVMKHPPEDGSIDFFIGRNPVKKNVMTHFTSMPENKTARDALTRYTTLKYFENFSLVEARPTTGRTHQIRVHLKAIGHPLLGDEVYGTSSKLIPYHALHAHTLQFNYNDKEYSFTCPLDEKMQNIINNHIQIDS